MLALDVAILLIDLAQGDIEVALQVLDVLRQTVHIWLSTDDACEIAIYDSFLERVVNGVDMCELGSALVEMRSPTSFSPSPHCCFSGWTASLGSDDVAS